MKANELEEFAENVVARININSFDFHGAVFIIHSPNGEQCWAYATGQPPTPEQMNEALRQIQAVEQHKKKIMN